MAALALVASLALPGPALGAPVAGAAATAVTVQAPAGSGCVQGLRDIAMAPDSGKISALVSLGGKRVLGVGSIAPGVEKATALRILTARHTAAGWTFATSAGPGGSAAALVAIDRAPNGDAWAAGFHFDSRLVQRPLVMRRTASGWRDASPPARPGLATAIAGDAADGLWVATTEIIGRNPVARVWRRDGTRWRLQDLPSVKGVERFTAIAAPTAGHTWVAGSTVTAGGLAPVIVARDGGTWRREPVETGDGEVLIASLLAVDATTIRAAGWALGPSRIRPVLLGRDPDGTWRPIDLPGAKGVAGIISELAARVTGIVAAGSSYVAAAGLWVPALADPSTDPSWLITARPGWFVQAITGDPAADGWMAATATVKGRDHDSMLARLCDLAAPDDLAMRRRLVELRQRRLARAAARQAAQDRRAARRQARQADHPETVRIAPAGDISGGFTLRDIATRLGLPAKAGSYGIDQGDVDGDGRKDLVWSGHGGPLNVYLRTGSGYERFRSPAFGPVDRHTCVAARIDADEIADIACVTGAMHGMGITSNELYLDPTADGTRDVGVERGLTDPVARGRVLVGLDAEGDGDTDLYVASQERYDGFPTVDRLLLNDGDGHFTWALDSGLTASFGAACGIARDLDRDGRMDLLVCQDTEAPSGAGIWLYRNLGDGRFRSVGGAQGLRTIGDLDVDAGQLGGSAHLDIVQLAGDHLRVSLWNGSRYAAVLDRAIVAGGAVSIGDVDGDGDGDIYVAMGSNRDPVTDVILLNDGSGRGWTQVKVPDTAAGPPDEMLAADLDGDGRDEFLLVSGRGKSGPVRVIDAH